jgi:biopolymer transport protein ExbD
MARNHRRMARPPRLNLVALMDIFTILVLFLIVNNGDVEVLQADGRVALPESVSEQRPEATIVIKVTETDILLAGEHVSTMEAALTGPEETIAPLVAALESAATERPTAIEEDHSNGRPVIIMGDRSTPYALLKRIMATCAETDYRDISLAVNSMPVNSLPQPDTTLALTGAAR